MGFFSSLGSFCSSAISTVREAASSAWGAAKNVAGRAMEWMSEKAEGFIGNVKNVWQSVKPFVEHTRAALRLAADKMPIPWLKGAMLLLEKGLGGLEKLENSPIAQKIDAAIQWAIQLAKRWQGKQEELTEEELETAKKHRDDLRFAEREAEDVASQHQIALTGAINDFAIARTELANAIASEPADFEHYLRLRATQKLMAMAESKFHSAQTVDDLSADDLFLVRVAADLIKADPELNVQAAERLDRILSDRFGTKLTPFVFEEMIASWYARAEAVKNQWDEKNKQVSRNSMLLKRLELAKEIQSELSNEEAVELAKLLAEVPEQKQELDSLALVERDITRYACAAEGLLQLMEKTEEQIKADDREYLLEDSERVGLLLIDFAKNDKKYIDLPESERNLINNYANIFKKEAKARKKKVLEVTV